MVSRLKRQDADHIPPKLLEVDYTNDLALLSNTLAQAESMLHSLEQAARYIGFYVNSDKTEFTYIKQDFYVKWQASEISWPVQITR